MTNLFGWEMIFKAVKLDMKRDSDYIVAFAHWFLVQRANLRCLGNGKDLRLRNNETGSEMLPADWNRNDKSYALRYVLNDQVYVLLGTNSEDAFIMNLLSADKMDLSNVSFHTVTVTEWIKATNCLITGDLQGLIDRFTIELLNPVFESDTKHASTQTVTDLPRSVPRCHSPDRSAQEIDFDLERQRERIRQNHRDAILGVGQRDLNPFAVNGGGMLFDPPRDFPNIRDPNLRFPPGARFDPFGPPPANLRRPNHDHFPPPGFEQGNINDDMFM